jgi:hypothetical protein
MENKEGKNVGKIKQQIKFQGKLLCVCVCAVIFIINKRNCAATHTTSAAANVFFFTNIELFILRFLGNKI